MLKGINGRSLVLEDCKSDSKEKQNNNNKHCLEVLEQREDNQISPHGKAGVPDSFFLAAYGVQRPDVRPLQNSVSQLLFVHNSIKVRLRYHFSKKFPGDFNATEFGNVGEGVETTLPSPKQELLLYCLMFSSWGLGIKPRQDRLTGEKVNSTGIWRLHRIEVKTPKKWLDPGANIPS